MFFPVPPKRGSAQGEVAVDATVSPSLRPVECMPVAPPSPHRDEVHRGVIDWRPFGRFVAALIAPWLIFGLGLMVIQVIPDPQLVLGLWYLSLWSCLCVILVEMAAGVWELIRSAPRWHPYWAWGLLAGSIVNFFLLGKVGGH